MADTGEESTVSRPQNTGSCAKWSPRGIGLTVLLLIVAWLALGILFPQLAPAALVANSMQTSGLLVLDETLAAEVQATPTTLTLSGGGPGMLILSWDRCVHCRVLRASFETLLSTAKGNPQLRVAHLEQKEAEHEMLNYLRSIGVHDGTFPRVLGWRAGALQPLVYSGDRSVESLRDFAVSLL
jgi:hypothetical protein